MGAEGGEAESQLALVLSPEYSSTNGTGQFELQQASVGRPIGNSKGHVFFAVYLAGFF